MPLINNVRSYVSRVLVPTMNKVLRVHGTYPIALLKIRKDTTSAKGWSLTQLGTVTEGEGMYSKGGFTKMASDVANASKEKDVIGVIYTIPFKDVKDTNGDSIGDLLLVGVHVMDNGVAVSDKMISYYKTTKLSDEESEIYGESIKNSYLKEYLAASKRPASEIETLLSTRDFEEGPWPSLKPKYIELVAEGMWGNLHMHKHVIASPFVTEARRG